jgi:predicted nucleic acid-binding protein
MNAIDTNVWVYSHDKRDRRKQEIAQHLIQTTQPLWLLWQVGCEFIAAARKLEPLGFTPEQAWQSLSAMQRMANAILLPTPELWVRCREIQQRFGVHYWDALIVAACMHAEVKTLYSEDIPERDYDGLRVVNPFRTGR